MTAGVPIVRSLSAEGENQSLKLHVNRIAGLGFHVRRRNLRVEKRPVGGLNTLASCIRLRQDSVAELIGGPATSRPDQMNLGICADECLAMLS
jgi:hypothetical protein